MTIPTSSSYPTAFDDDNNLFLVHDSLRVALIEDYNPGDTSITVMGDTVVLGRFPSTGIITLTEQCSDIDHRAISFYYSSVDAANGIFSGLELLPGFVDVVKPKTITNVTQNVMAKHHNYIKDALKAIQAFVGIKGTIDTEPFGETLEGRINFLRKLVLVPKAWFTANKRQGIVPLTVEFTERAFRLGTDGTAGPVSITWDFGDRTSSTVSYISTIDEVPDDSVDVIVRDTDGGKITKTYHRPGIYTVTMTVTNDFGSDELILDDFIQARIKAPNSAQINFDSGTVVSNPTRVRSPVNTLIRLSIPSGENPATPGYTYAGELLGDNELPLDPITSWYWALGDDILHEDGPSTTASYSVGGIYDLKIRVDTEFGAYRITTNEGVIDIIENTNLWLWTFQDSTTVRSYEYGLISETFKLTPSSGCSSIVRNDSFLDNVNNATQQKREFLRNTGFSSISSANSGSGGSAMLYWASGRNASDAITEEKINLLQYQGFLDTYTTPDPAYITRPWNWCYLASTMYAYFFGGEVENVTPNLSPVNTELLQQNTSTLTTTTTSLTSYLNGAEELEQNPAIYDSNGVSTTGNFSVYRTAWKDNTGYIARNDSVGVFFRIKSFYRTTGTISNPIMSMEKLMDIAGLPQVEGGMTDLSQGVYFFNNSGSVASFSPTTALWYQGGPGINSMAYRALQDTTVEGFDSTSNTLLVTSDKDKRAYISFDYSDNVFIKFNELDNTFSTLGSRPTGEQWIMSIY
jgi:PKD repeat protein